MKIGPSVPNTDAPFWITLIARTRILHRALPIAKGLQISAPDSMRSFGRDVEKKGGEFHSLCCIATDHSMLYIGDNCIPSAIRWVIHHIFAWETYKTK